MILAQLQSRFFIALTGFVDDPQDYVDFIRKSQSPKFGDFQANMAMPIAKSLKQPPRNVAEQIVARLQIDDLCHPPEIAGAGFINLRIREDKIAECLIQASADERLGVSCAQPKKFVVDYSAPNVAKPMHVGHIRSTVIGNTIAKILRFLGHSVITDNHIGDWGTQFGMIIYGYRNFLDSDAYKKAPVDELSRIYRHVRKLIDEKTPGIEAAAHLETVKLHQGDAENRRLWQEFMPFCIKEIQHIYDRLGISFDFSLGESFYNDFLPYLVDSLLKNNLAQETEGAIGVFLDGFEVPMLVRKKDGAFLYATTDLATIQYRIREFSPDVILYVVDFRQSLHFEQLFAAAKKIGYKVELKHIKFGTVLGDDGKAFKTRSGDTVGLISLLDEAEKRALAIVLENSSCCEIPEGKYGKPATTGGNEAGGAAVHTDFGIAARRIGIGAIIYSDLCQNRESDYVFSFDKMLAMNGNTATYMQYAFARVQSIFAKGNINVDLLRENTTCLHIQHEAERNLGLMLLQFGDALEMTVRDFRPNFLTVYLFELANCFSSFFENCPVLKAEDEPTKNSRLFLCDLTARIIQKGLELLGIETVDRM